MNWDAQYDAMGEAFYQHVASHNALDEGSLAECKKVVKSVRRNHDSADRLIQLALAWVRRNPNPIVLRPPSYSR